jgi:elongation factor Ts
LAHQFFLEKRLSFSISTFQNKFIKEERKVAEITASSIKELRERTQAGLLACKKALAENDGDMEKAADYLRKKGLATANKKAGREASEGIIAIEIADKKAVMLQLNCETDFVAKNDDFQKLAKEVISQIDAADDNITVDNLPENISDTVKNGIATIGENMGIGGFTRFKIPADKEGFIASYIHNNKKIGVMIELNCNKADVVNNSEVQALGNDLAMQIAAANPQFVSSDQVPADQIEREKSIYFEQMKDSGKPENVLEKIVEGKIKKYYSEVCLLDQEYIKESKLSIRDLIKKISDSCGDEISVSRFTRYQIGA